MVKRDLIRNIIIAVLAIVVISLLRVFVLSTHRVTEGQANDYIHAGDYVTFNKKVEPRIIRTLSCIRLMVRNIPVVSLQMKVRV